MHYQCITRPDSGAVQPELMALQEKGLNDTSYAYIASMAVPPAWRRRGVASALLASAERWAGKWHQNWVLLHAYQSNATGGSLHHPHSGGLQV